MSCKEELEGVLGGLGPHLKDCTVAMYNGCGTVMSADVKGMCDANGAKCSKVFTVSSVSQDIGKLKE